jgi:hypothetical protein
MDIFYKFEELVLALEAETKMANSPMKLEPYLSDDVEPANQNIRWSLATANRTV